MILDVRDYKARGYKLIDMDTGKEIPFAFWADDETGNYKVYENDGSHIIHRIGFVSELELKGNIKLCLKNHQ